MSIQCSFRDMVRRELIDWTENMEGLSNRGRCVCAGLHNLGGSLDVQRGATPSFPPCKKPTCSKHVYKVMYCTLYVQHVHVHVHVYMHMYKCSCYLQLQ